MVNFQPGNLGGGGGSGGDSDSGEINTGENDNAEVYQSVDDDDDDDPRQARRNRRRDRDSGVERTPNPAGIPDNIQSGGGGGGTNYSPTPTDTDDGGTPAGIDGPVAGGSGDTADIDGDPFSRGENDVQRIEDVRPSGETERIPGEQGLEAGSDAFSSSTVDRARQFESDILDRYPNLDADDVVVRGGNDGLSASLTQSGRDAFDFPAVGGSGGADRFVNELPERDDDNVGRFDPTMDFGGGSRVSSGQDRLPSRDRSTRRRRGDASPASSSEAFGDDGTNIPGFVPFVGGMTTEEYVEGQAESFSNVSRTAGNIVGSSVDATLLGGFRLPSSFSDLTDNPTSGAGRTAAGITDAGLQLLNVPQYVAAGDEAQEFASYSFDEFQSGGGEELAVDVGQTGTLLVQSEAQRAQENPFRFTGELAGGLITGTAASRAARTFTSGRVTAARSSLSDSATSARQAVSDRTPSVRVGVEPDAPPLVLEDSVTEAIENAARTGLDAPGRVGRGIAEAPGRVGDAVTRANFRAAVNADSPLDVDIPDVRGRLSSGRERLSSARDRIATAPARAEMRAVTNEPGDSPLGAGTPLSGLSRPDGPGLVSRVADATERANFRAGLNQPTDTPLGAGTSLEPLSDLSGVDVRQSLQGAVDSANLRAAMNEPTDGPLGAGTPLGLVDPPNPRAAAQRGLFRASVGAADARRSLSRTGDRIVNLPSDATESLGQFGERAARIPGEARSAASDASDLTVRIGDPRTRRITLPDVDTEPDGPFAADDLGDMDFGIDTGDVSGAGQRAETLTDVRDAETTTTQTSSLTSIPSLESIGGAAVGAGVSLGTGQADASVARGSESDLLGSPSLLGDAERQSTPQGFGEDTDQSRRLAVDLDRGTSLNLGQDTWTPPALDVGTPTALDLGTPQDTDQRSRAAFSFGDGGSRRRPMLDLDLDDGDSDGLFSFGGAETQETFGVADLGFGSDGGSDDESPFSF